jgi:hypothetical protein
LTPDPDPFLFPEDSEEFEDPEPRVVIPVLQNFPAPLLLAHKSVETKLDPFTTSPSTSFGKIAKSVLESRKISISLSSVRLSLRCEAEEEKESKTPNDSLVVTDTEVSSTQKIGDFCHSGALFCLLSLSLLIH